jgi:uncharacterized protein (DUF2147 family)
MINRLLFILALSLAPFAAQAQSDGRAILGEWLNEDKDAKVSIYQEGDKFYGKVSWLKDPNGDDGKPKVDEKNPDAAKRSRPVKGLVLLKDFRYEDKEWKGGTIYDPKNGKTYDCYMAFESSNKLKIRGFVMGMRALGRTTYWTR